MIRFENAETAGWKSAVRGMRNPMNSWSKTDSTFKDDYTILGENDLKLMKKLSSSGADHRKYLRMIVVYVDITAPLYWWKEFDTYKVGTVANSCSTMHKIHDKEFTIDDFSFDESIDDFISSEAIYKTIAVLNINRDMFIKTNDKRYWRYMIELLPSSYNQKRTVELNYEVLKNIYSARKNHKLTEWHSFCDWILTLPYAEILIP